MAKRKRKSGRSKKLPLMIVAPMAAPVIEGAMAGFQSKSMTEALYPLTGMGSDGSLHTDRLVQTYVPIGLGIIGHKVVGKAVNRYIPKWIPFNF